MEKTAGEQEGITPFRCDISSLGDIQQRVAEVEQHAFVPKMGVYCATKSAVNCYVECLQNEIRASAVNIHLVCPPAVNTPLVDQCIDTDAAGSILNAKRSGRLADPEKIIDAIDKGVAKNRDIIYPGEARFLYLVKALLPKVWWKLVLSYEK